jgi:hypothetical protein
MLSELNRRRLAEEDMNMGRAVLIGALVAVMSGCANPGIVQLSPDTYMLARTDHGGIFGNAAANKAKVMQEAHDFAASKGKVAIPLASNEVPLGTGPGQFASFEYQFRLADPNDPEARNVNPISTTVTPYGSVQGSTAAPVAQILQRAGTAMQEAPLVPYKQKCLSFGFEQGTPAFAQCVQREYNAAQPARPIVCTADPLFLTCEQ